MEALQVNYPTELAQVESELLEAEEAQGDDVDYEQLGRLREEKLMALTIKVRLREGTKHALMDSLPVKTKSGKIGIQRI